MDALTESRREPTHDEMEGLFVNNASLDRIKAYLNRFNPIRTMNMERMEIRHSAILAWLLDPAGTHGLGDSFLKSFLGEALRGRSGMGKPTALAISQSNLRDAEVRSEWQNIDIFILSPANRWAFIIENKFGSKQREGQLAGYAAKVRSIFGEQSALDVRGIFLTLQDEAPADESYVQIGYEAICEILPRMMKQYAHQLSPEVITFLIHYLDILKDETGMSEERTEMKRLARQLYRDHKKVLDFVIKHGAGSDFAMAARMLFGEDPKPFETVDIDNNKFVFSGLNNTQASFLPFAWYEQLSRDARVWSGCEDWWATLPLIAWLCLAHDKQMAEDRQWLAQHRTQARSPASESDDDGLVYKDYDNSALQPAYEPEPEGFTEYQRDVLVEVIAELRAEWQEAIDRRFAALKNENAELKGMISTVLQIIGEKLGNCTTVQKPESEVVELLPNWRKRGDAA